MPELSSDPHAWLRLYFAALRERPEFGYLSPQHQFEALCAAIQPEHPQHATSLREWSPAAQGALLKWLSDVTTEQPPASEYERWRVSKNGRELRCVAVYLPTGIDVRLMEGSDFRRTQLAKTAPEADTVADEWRVKLREAGWTVAAAPPA